MASSNPPSTNEIDSLIIVCCHAIWIGETALENSPSTAEDEWLIESFQTGETPTFIAHIKAGIAILEENPHAVLVFSGGPTKPSRSDRSEGESYRLYAEKYGLISDVHEARQRVFVDEYATDSFQNVLFSLLQFPIFIQEYQAKNSHPKPQDSAPQSPAFPRHLAIVSHNFKRDRFEELHLPALKYPTTPARFEYIGIDPPFDEQKLQEIRDGDLKRGFGVWQTDFYGKGAILAQKRVARGWTKERRTQFQEMMRLRRFGSSAVSAWMQIVLFAVGSDEQDQFPGIMCWA